MNIPLKRLKILNTKCPICNKEIADDEYYKKKALWHKRCYKLIELGGCHVKTMVD